MIQLHYGLSCGSCERTQQLSHLNCASVYLNSFSWNPNHSSEQKSPPHAFKKKILGGQPLMDCHHLSGPAVESTSLTVWASGPFGFLESHGQHFIFLWRIENKKLNDSQMPRNVLYTKGGATPRWTTVGHIDTIDILYMQPYLQPTSHCLSS